MKPTVRIFSGATSKSLVSLAPFSTAFHGGVSVAAADLNGDHRADVVVGSGSGLQTAVSIYSGATRRVLWTLEPFGPIFRGGTAVAAGLFEHGTTADVVVGAGAGGGCQIRIWNERTHALVTSFLGAPGSAAV